MPLRHPAVARGFARVLAVVAATLGLLTALATPASAANWYFEDLDGPDVPGGFNRTGTRVSGAIASIDYGNAPHVFYHDAVAGRLRHGWWGGDRWYFEDLDGEGVPGGNGRTATGDVGEHASATVWNGEPHVFYRDATAGRLRHAWWNGAAWFFEDLDGPGTGEVNGRTGNQVAEFTRTHVYGGWPHVFYRDTEAGRLRHAWWSGSAWYFESLDGRDAPGPGRTSDDVGAHIEVTVDRDALDVYHVASSADGTRLRRAGWTGAVWEVENLDGPGSIGDRGRTTGSVGHDVAGVIWSNETHLFYGDTGGGHLRHGWNNGTGNFEVLDGAGGDFGRATARVGSSAAAFVYGNVPHVVYHDETNGRMRHAWWGGLAWYFEDLDGNGVPGGFGRSPNDVGEDNTALVWRGQPHVFHIDVTTGRLRHAWYG